MGYTHYWTITPHVPEPNELAGVAEDAAKIIAASEIAIRGGHGSGEPDISPTGIHFNGDDTLDESYESFDLTVDLSGFNFCKTAQRPYDVVVTAVLLAAKDRLGSLIALSSDGDPVDWAAGLNLARRATGRPGIAGFVFQASLGNTVGA